MVYDFTLIFGKKGSGKSSLMAKIAKKYSKQGITCLCTEANICNTYYIPFSDIGKYWLPENSILLIDELSCCANSRSFKSTPLSLLNWFKYSRHNKVKVFAFTQVFNDSDLQIRMLADNMFLAKNRGFFASYRRICKVLDIRTDANGVGQIVDSFERAPLFGRGNVHFCSLRKYRKYFDSFSRLPVPDLCLDSCTYTEYIKKDNSFFNVFNKKDIEENSEVVLSDTDVVDISDKADFEKLKVL